MAKKPKAEKEKKERQRHTKLDIEIIDVLRDKNYALKKENARLAKEVLTLDKALAIVSRRSSAAESDTEVLMDALRYLAGIPAVTVWSYRRARAEARKMLEDADIRPPSGLGSSRDTPKRKKRRKKSS